MKTALLARLFLLLFQYDAGFPHDAAYKTFFSDPEMVASLVRNFVPEPFVADYEMSSGRRARSRRDIGRKLWRCRVAPAFGTSAGS